jgi:hypothetical protein
VSRTRMSITISMRCGVWFFFLVQILELDSNVKFCNFMIAVAGQFKIIDYFFEFFRIESIEVPIDRAHLGF